MPEQTEQQPPFPAKAVANAFLELANREGKPLSPMKLQKLVYFAHGWHLAITKRPLIRESIQAWKFGPVVEDLYHEFKEFGNEPITRQASVLRILENNRLEEWHPQIDDENANEIIAKVWEVYGAYSAIQLSNMTHADDTPWHQIASDFPDGLDRRVDIPDDLIRDFFVRRD